MKTERTRYIILRKTPYQETSLVIAGISSQHGRIDLMVRGGQKIGSKSLPVIDLFREIEIAITARTDKLQTIYSADLISNFDNIALNRKSFMDACEISKFVLRNSQPAIPSPLTYQSVKTAFKALSTSGEVRYSPWVKLAILEEHGLIPEQNNNTHGETNILKQLLKASIGEAELPQLDPRYMREIEKWIDSVCKYNGLIK